MNHIRQLVQELGHNWRPIKEDAIYRLFDGEKWNRANIDALYLEAQKEKVVPVVYRNAQLLNEQQPHPVLQRIIETLEEENTWRTRFTRQTVPNYRNEVAHVLAEANIEFLFIKGASLESYPHGYLRQMNDLDLIFQNWDDLFLAAKALCEQGWQLVEIGEEAPWIMYTSPESADLSGMQAHINLVKYIEDNSFIILDLHLHPFLVALTGKMDAPIWQRTSTKNPRIPAVEDKLLILIAHAVNHGYFLLKDFNDAYAILERSQDSFDWEYFYKYAEENVLSYAVAYLFEYIASFNHLQSIIQLPLRKPPHKLLTRAIRLTSLADKKRWEWLEILGHVLHTVAYEKRKVGWRSGFILSSRLLSWRTKFALLQSTLGDHAITQRLLHRTNSLLFPVPLRGQHILLLPVRAVCEETSPETIAKYAHIPPLDLASSLSEQTTWDIALVHKTAFFVRSGNAELIVTTIGWFVPSIDGVFNDSQLEAVEKLVADLAQTCWGH